MAKLTIKHDGSDYFDGRILLQCVLQLLSDRKINSSTQVNFECPYDAKFPVKLMNFLKLLIKSFDGNPCKETLTLVLNSGGCDIYDGNKKTIFDAPRVLKLHEYNLKHNLDDNNFVYISGYTPELPQIGDQSILVGPNWSWSNDEQIILSGVNFLKVLYSNLPLKTDKKFCAILIGSSTINKNILLGSVCIFVAQYLRRLKSLPIKPACIILKKYPDHKGKIIFQATVTAIKLMRLFGFRTKLIAGNNTSLSHADILMLIKQSNYVFIPYLREGFPRVLGEAVLCKVYPIIGNWLRFGSKDLVGVSRPRSLFGCVNLLSSDYHTSASASVEIGNLEQVLLYSPKKIVDCALRMQLCPTYERTENRDIIMAKCIYYLLTKDDSWF